MYKRNVSEIHTYQIAILALHPLARGWRVFLIDRHGQYEIELGADNKRTDREISGTHNLLNLYLTGKFKYKKGTSDESIWCCTDCISRFTCAHVCGSLPMKRDFVFFD